MQNRLHGKRITEISETFMISLGIFGIDSAVLAIVALLTGAGLVALAMWLAGLISPRSFNPQIGRAHV